MASSTHDIARLSPGMESQHFYFQNHSHGELASPKFEQLLTVVRMYLAGDALPGLESSIKEYERDNERFNSKNQESSFSVIRQALEMLTHSDDSGHAFSTSDNHYSLFVSSVEQSKMSMFLRSFLGMMNCCFMGEVDEGLKRSELLSGCLDVINDSLVRQLFFFHDALLRVRYVRAHPDLSGKIRRRYLKAAAKNNKHLQCLEDSGGMETEHRWALIEAERARLKGDIVHAMQMYQTAVDGARKYQLIHEEALAHELSAEFYLDHRHQVAANAHLLNALDLYSRWGAAAKVQRLYSLHPYLQTNREQPATPQARSEMFLRGYTTLRCDYLIEMNALIHAAEQFYEEFNFADLIERISRVFQRIGQTAKASVFLEDKGELVLANSIDSCCTGSTQESEDQPAAILYYVHRTQKPVLSSGQGWNCFLGLNEANPSAYCLPLVHQNRAVGVVYVENLSLNQENRDGTMRFLEMAAGKAACIIKKAKGIETLKKSAMDFAATVVHKDEQAQLTAAKITGYRQLYTIDEQTADEIQALLNKLMVEQMVYRNNTLSLEMLAEMTRYSSRAVSEVINVRFNKNFYRFVNDFRIEDVKKRLRQPYDSAGVLEISLDAGFSSKSSFNAFFKQCTGMTPSTYRNKYVEKRL